MAGFTTLMQNPNYFQRHPFEYHGEEVDYVTVAFGYGFGISIPGLEKIGPGGQIAITRDRFGRWYVSLGETGGIRIFPGSASVVAGHIISGNNGNLADTLADFLPGKSSNLTVSAGGSLGESQSGNIKAIEIGFSTPQISISSSFAWEIGECIAKKVGW